MREINRTAFLNILSVILVQGITFFTTPIFARLLNTEQYGQYSLYVSWLTVFTAIMGLGAGNALSVGRYDYKDVYYEFRSSIILLGNVVSGFIIIVSLVFHDFLVERIGFSAGIIVLMLLSSLSNYNIAVSQGALIYEKKPKVNFYISLMLTILNVGLSLGLVFFSPVEYRYIARIVGFSAAQIIVGSSVSVAMFLRKPYRLNKDYSFYSIKFGLPIVFHTLSYSVLIQSDRIMMDSMGVGDHYIGIYSLYYSFTSILSVILSSLNNTWCPFMYDDLSKDDNEALIRKAKHYIELFSVLTVGFLLLSHEVGYIFAGDAYSEGLGLTPILTMSVYMTFMYQFPVNFEFYHKKSNFVAIGTVGAAVLNIILNYFFVTNIGYYGAAVATAISYLFLFLLHYFIVNFVINYDYCLNLVLYFPGILMVSLFVAMTYLCIGLPILRWGLAIVIGIVEGYRIIRRKSIF